MFIGNCVNKVMLEINSHRTYEIITALQKEGYEVHKDFSFCYVPASHNNNYRSYVEFTFYTESLATWFAIKYN